MITPQAFTARYVAGAIIRQLLNHGASFTKVFEPHVVDLARSHYPTESWRDDHWITSFAAFIARFPTDDEVAGKLVGSIPFMDFD